MLRLCKAFALLMWLLLASLLMWGMHVLGLHRACMRHAQLTSRGLLWILGVQCSVIGTVSPRRPLMLVANHLSYLDILIILSVQQCRFVAKQEISGWPIMGMLCRATGVIFVDRRPTTITEGQTTIAQALTKGEIILLFPEATTGDGRHLLPFKPAFFEVAARESASVQPMAIRYRTVHGLPLDHTTWPMVAWYGDMELLPHLWNLLKLGRLEVSLALLPPLPSSDRKSLAQQSAAEISQALQCAS